MKLKISFLLLLAIVFAIFFIGKQSPLEIAKEDWNRLLNRTKQALIEKKELDLPIENKWKEPSVVFISVCDGFSPAVIKIGKGDNLIAAINQAINKFQDINQIKLIKLDIVKEIKYAGQFLYKSKIKMPLEPSLWGISFDENFTLAFLPETVVSQSFVSRKNTLNMRNIKRYVLLDHNLKKAQKEVFKKEEKNVFQFNTISYLLDEEVVYKLYRGNRIKPKLTEEYLTDALNSACVYLTKAVDDSGKFNYIYLPRSGRVPNKYNLVRHAGTVYSMLELYEFNRDPELLKSAKRAINFLLVHLKPCSLNALCFVDDGYYKLGGNGLSVVALAKYIDATKDTKYLPIMQKLCNQILASQNEKGKFVIEKMGYPNGNILNFDSVYYPGEAILGLLRMYEHDNDPKWLDAAIKAMDWIINVRDYFKIYADHWLLYGLNDIYRYHKSNQYLKHTKKIVKKIFDEQHKWPKHPDWYGGFYSPPRSTPTATRSEGLIAAYKLFNDYDDRKFADKIYQTTTKAIQFQLINQFRLENSMYLNDPIKPLGGFKRSLNNFEIRIDYVQHNISSILAYLKILKTI